MNTLVNILIRHSEGRQNSLEYLLHTIQQQTYKNVRVIISVDFPCPDYIPSWCEVIGVSADKSLECYYNLYCNDLKAMVTDGYFIFIDDDDFIDRANALSAMVSELDAEHVAVIFQFLRGKKKKPDYRHIRHGVKSGTIGLPCLVLHHSKKHVADIEIGDNGDYKWIKAVTMRMNFRFAPIVIVRSPKRSYGK